VAQQLTGLTNLSIIHSMHPFRPWAIMGWHQLASHAAFNSRLDRQAWMPAVAWGSCLQVTG